ncbi:PilZ domain-containing protein [Microvirga roseola]|uniref:PilZ domain-containing protein n=1 Tax=Microvirga roseola TaxID=2883126 RepID=UPI003898F184
MYTHKQVWAAFETIAKRCGMSLSALSKEAGLDPTSFNPSKRYGPNGRQRWPSTETLVRVLHVANLDMRAFAEILEIDARYLVEEPLPSRRRGKRFATILKGRIRLGTEAAQIPCRISCISVSGARIGLTEDIELPGEFELEIPRLEHSLKVRLIWSRANSHGVTFLEDPRQDLSGNWTSFLDALRTPDDGTYSNVASDRRPPSSPIACGQPPNVMSRKPC